MASKGTKVTDREKKQILAAYAEDASINRIAKQFKRSFATVKAIVDEGKKSGVLLKKIETIKKKNADDILATIMDDDTIEIISRYKELLRDEDIVQDAVYGKAKIQPFINAIGMFVDKALTYQRNNNDRDRDDNMSVDVIGILKSKLSEKDNV